MKTDGLQISFAALTDEKKIIGFLNRNDLLHQDITRSHLDNFLLLWDGSKLVGTVGLEIKGHCALLRSLAVEESYRKKGWASQLLDKIEQHAKTWNVNTLYLLTMTVEAFFAKRGYEKIERDTTPPSVQETEEFKGLCPDTAVCMVKYLY
ncbi:MAG: arsenic resistance N-acetyltransferase ArsN2 [Desulfobacterales bacterium]|jgi:amino-acid N-acetyltransferase